MVHGRIAHELKKVASQYGILTPELVVTAAEDPLSPLHDCFDWNDEQAATKHRLWQARQLIVTVKVKIDDKPMRAYHNAKVMIRDEEYQAYFPIESVLKNDNIKKSVIKDALEALQHWERKYNDLVELSGVLNKDKIEEVGKKVQK